MFSVSLSSAWKLPGLKQLRRSGRLNALLRKGYGPHWGRFQTYGDAFAFLRPSDRLTFRQDSVVQNNISTFKQVHLYDWPILFFLFSLIHDGKVRVITDFGGHVGVKFYAYRSLLKFPSDLAWQVVDLPEICREGEKRRDRSELQLKFFDSVDAAPACDMLICSGVLQYSDIELEDIFKRLSTKPKFALLNKIAVIKDGREGFYTIEAYGFGKMPYRIFAQGDLDCARVRLGYRLVRRWSIPYRDFDVPSERRTDRIEMIGEAWALEPSSPEAAANRSP